MSRLYRTRPGSEGRRYPLKLHAPGGSAAHYVLTLIGLPHTTSDPHEPRNVAPAGTDPA